MQTRTRMKIQAYHFIVGLLLMPFALNAQQDVHPCSTVDAEHEIRAAHPEALNAIEEAEAELERFTQERVHAQHNRAAQELYIVPVVVHVIHDNGPENISDAQVENSIQVLNDDFNGLNDDTVDVVEAFKDVIGVSHIEFRLAQLDPNGQPTNGIERYEDVATYSADDGVKSGRQWPREMYLNVYVVENIASGAAGYSRYPGSVSGAWGAEVDGIVIRHDYMGQIGTASAERRTLTHEVGHWLNLRHCWGNSNDPVENSNCNDDDLVNDTPNTIGWQSCDLDGETCGSLDNVQNHMEYSYCSRMFTEQQAIRMRAAMESGVASRSNLTTVANLQATGTYELTSVDFSTPYPTVCAGEPVFFRDLSTYGGETFAWNFTGPENLQSTERFPLMTFSEPGIYSVDLTVTQGSISLSESKSQYVVVVESPGDLLPISEDFEAATLTYDWIPFNPGGNSAWALNNEAAYNGTTAVKLANLGEPEDERDELISRSFDLSTMTSGQLSFKYAYAQADSNSNDRLLLSISNNCGKNWIIKAGLQGELLATAPAQATAFVPSDTSQWHEMSVNLSNSFLTENFRFKITFLSGGGNDVFVDDINVNGTFSTVPFLVSPADEGIAPNLGAELDWKAVALAEGYQYQLDTTPLFNSPFKRTASTTAIDNTSNNADTKYEMEYLPHLWTYYWRVRALVGGIGQQWSETWSFTTEVVAGTDELSQHAPEIRLFPNPATGQTGISVANPVAQQANVRLIDVTGRVASQVYNGTLAAGPQYLAIPLNGLPAGMYFVQVQLGETTQIKRLVVR